MTRQVLLIAATLALATSAFGQRSVTFEKFQVTDTAVGLADATTDPVSAPQIRACQGRVETGEIRVLDQRAGTVGSTTGLVLGVGEAFTFDSHDLASEARFIKTGSTTGVVQITCWE